MPEGTQVKRTVSEHGGDNWLTSEYGSLSVGSTVHVRSAPFLLII